MTIFYTVIRQKKLRKRNWNSILSNWKVETRLKVQKVQKMLCNREHHIRDLCGILHSHTTKKTEKKKLEFNFIKLES